MRAMTDMRYLFRRLAFVFFVLVLIAAARPVLAQGVERIGDYKDWSAYKFSEDGKPACYIASQPKKAVGKYKKRGDIFATVTHRPAEKSRDVVSIEAGYSYKKDSTVKVTIGEQSFSLFTQDDSAWMPNPEGDKKLVKAMIKGSSMVVEGTSLRGTETKDTYSLSGFTRAYNAINKACK